MYYSCNLCTQYTQTLQLSNLPRINLRGVLMWIFSVFFWFKRCQKHCFFPPLIYQPCHIQILMFAFILSIFTFQKQMRTKAFKIENWCLRVRMSKIYRKLNLILFGNWSGFNDVTWLWRKFIYFFLRRPVLYTNQSHAIQLKEELIFTGKIG